MPLTKEKKRRLEVIGNLITENRSIGSQQEIVDLLKELGITATQSSVSRDLQELGIKRVKGRYVLKPWKEIASGDFEGVAGLIQQVNRAGDHLAVILTSPKAAALVSDAIDHADWPEVAGTIAGDDTLFIATRSGEDQTALFDRFRQYLKRSGNVPGL